MVGIIILIIKFIIVAVGVIFYIVLWLLFFLWFKKNIYINCASHGHPSQKMLQTIFNLINVWAFQKCSHSNETASCPSESWSDRLILQLTWHDIQPSMVTHTRNSCSAYNPSKVRTHSSEHTHTVNTHPEQWAAIYAAAPGEQLGVRCLAQGHLSRGIEGGESAVHSLTSTYNSYRPETRTRNLWITSPTL